MEARFNIPTPYTDSGGLVRIKMDSRKDAEALRSGESSTGTLPVPTNHILWKYVEVLFTAYHSIESDAVGGLFFPPPLGGCAYHFPRLGMVVDLVVGVTLLQENYF